MTNNRNFSEVKKEHKKFRSSVILPVRSDKKSAGYDFFSNETITLKGNHIDTSKLTFILDEETNEIIVDKDSKMQTVYDTHLFWTDLKIELAEDEFMAIFIRSSLGTKKLMLTNVVGIIDSSYANNPKNDGNIGISITNYGTNDFIIEKGSGIAQGIIFKYGTTDADNFLDRQRNGGFGSSNEALSEVKK